jgi:hypothetical protein
MTDKPRWFRRKGRLARNACSGPGGQGGEISANFSSRGNAAELAKMPWAVHF